MPVYENGQLRSTCLTTTISLLKYWSRWLEWQTESGSCLKIDQIREIFSKTNGSYLDTSRGLRSGDGGKAVFHRRAGHCLRHHRQRALWGDLLACQPDIKGGQSEKKTCREFPCKGDPTGLFRYCGSPLDDPCSGLANPLSLGCVEG